MFVKLKPAWAISAGLLLGLSLVLMACGESPTSTPQPTTANPTTVPGTTAPATATVATTAAPTTTAPATTTAAPTTALTTTAPATTVAVTTAPATTTTSATSLQAPAWFKDLPAYTGTQPLSLDPAIAAGLGLDPKQFYFESYSVADSPDKVVSFYSDKLKSAGWQVAQQVPLSSDEKNGQQVSFTRSQNGANQLLILLSGTAAALQGVPNTAKIAAQLPAGRNLLMLITKADQVPQETPTTPAEAPTTGLPEGVAAKNYKIDFGDGWVTQAQITYPANKPGPFPTLILVHGSGLNDMDESLPESVSGVPGGSKFFQPIAYYLSTRGFAVIRYNKRGVVGIGPQLSSDPKFTNLAKPDTQYAQDAAFVLKDSLKNTLVDPKRVILLGHSEGTLNVSHVATSADSDAVAGVVLMGVQGYDIKTVLQYQLIDRPIQALQQDADTNKDGKISVDEFLTWAKGLSAVYSQPYISQYLDADPTSAAKYKFKSILDKNGDGFLDLEGELRPTLQELNGVDKFPSVAAFGGDQAAPALKDWQDNGSVTTVLPTFKKPVLLLNGEADNQTIVQGAREVDAALAKAGNPDHTLKTYPGVGHSFYPAKGIDQPLGPPQQKVLQDLGDWLSERFNK